MIIAVVLLVIVAQNPNPGLNQAYAKLERHVRFPCVVVALLGSF
jgi:hypothetical protein